MTAIWNALNGKKTYLVVTIYIVCVLLEKFGGFDIPGFSVDANWLQQVLAMLGIGALRSGVAGK